MTGFSDFRRNKHSKHDHHRIIAKGAGALLDLTSESRQEIDSATPDMQDKFLLTKESNSFVTTSRSLTRNNFIIIHATLLTGRTPGSRTRPFSIRRCTLLARWPGRPAGKAFCSSNGRAAIRDTRLQCCGETQRGTDHGTSPSASTTHHSRAC